jgi:hypothetical protein
MVRQSAVAVGLALAVGAGAAAGAASPAHPQETPVVLALKLDAGKKWRTDEPLRNAMSDIRDSVAAESHALRAGTMNAATYEALARKIDARTADIVVNCKLAPDADAQLHVVLAQLMQGSVAMKGQDPSLARRTGADRIVGALEAYARHFEHPGWKSLPY